MYRNFNKVRASIFHFIAGRAVMILSAVLVSLMVVRGLSIVEFGQYVVLLGLMLVVSMVSDAGISRVQPRFLPELYIKKDVQGLVFLSRLLLWLRASLHGVLLVAIWMLYDLWSGVLDVEISDALVLVFVTYAFFYALNQQTQRTMQVLLMQKHAAKLTALEWLLKLLLLGAVYEGPDSFVLMDVFYIQMISVVIAFSVGQLILWRKSSAILRDKSIEHAEHLNLHEVFHFAWKNWLQRLLDVPLSPGVVRMLMAGIAGAVAVAYLGFAYTMMQLLQRILPSKMIVQAIEPVYIARYRESGDFKELNNMASLVLKLNYFILIPVMVWFALGSHAVLDWISAGKYGDSGWIIAALIFIFMFENHRMALQVLSNAVDQSILLVKSNLLACSLLPLYIAAAIYGDLYGLLLGLVIISWSRNLYLVYKLRQQGFDYQQDWMCLGKMVMAAAVSLLCILVVSYYFTGLLASLLAATLCAIVFYGMGLKVKFFKAKERDLVNRTLGKRLFLW